MKNIKPLLVCFAIALGLSACTITVKETLPGKNWKITRYVHGVHDDTQLFEGYTFLFKGNGQLVIKNGSQEFLGSWYINNNNGERVIISIPISIFEGLNHDWYVKTTDGSIVELEALGNEISELTLMIAY